MDGRAQAFQSLDCTRVATVEFLLEVLWARRTRPGDPSLTLGNGRLSETNSNFFFFSNDLFGAHVHESMALPCRAPGVEPTAAES